MSSRITQNLQCLGMNKVLVTCQFSPQGTGAPVTPTQGQKGIKSVTRTGVGLYTITFNSTWAFLAAFKYAFSLASGANLSVQIVSQSLLASGGGTVNIRIWDGVAAAVADIAANANNIVYLEFTLRNSPNEL